MSNRIRFHIRILILYIVLMPIATALAGIVGDVSLVNYVSLSYVVLTIFSNKGRIFFKKSYRGVYFYFIYFFISMLWCRSLTFSWYIATSLMNTVVVILALSDNYSAYELSRIKRAFLTGFMVFIVAAAFNIDSALTFRLTIEISSRMDSNDLACGLLIIIAILLEMLSYKRNTRIVTIALIFAGLTIILSGSRGAMLMFLGMLVWWVIIANNRRGFASIFFLVMGAILFMVVYDYLPVYLQGRMDFNSIIEDGGSGRIKIWTNALKTFANSNPLRMLIGYGYSSFRDVVNYVATGHTRAYESHNIFVNALIEGGIIGFALIVYMLIQSYKLAKSKNNMAGMLSIVGLVISGCTLDMQAYRIFAMVFVVVILFEGNMRYEFEERNGFRNHSGL